MYSSTFKVSILVLVAVAGIFAGAAIAADEKAIVGTWRLKFDPGDGQTHEPTLKITKDRAGLKGEFSDGEHKLKVKGIQFKDRDLLIKLEGEVNGDPVTSTYKGKVEGDSIKGEG